MKRLLIILFCLCGPWLSFAAVPVPVKEYSVKVLATYPHDMSAYTQGLFFYGPDLYESTGICGASSLRKVDLKSGKVLRNVSVPSRYFGEGSAVVDSVVYMLTWQSRIAMTYDLRTFKHLRSISYPREGWGLTAIPENARAGFPKGAAMIASDGSSSLFVLDRNLRTLSEVKVKFNGRSVQLLNELEWIDGKVWANVYTTDLIVIIDPLCGDVVGKVDCTSLWPAAERTKHMDVLNGIARNGAGEIFLTGKYWPKMFKVKLVER